MLPFTNKDKQKFQCFVCGKEYVDFDAYKDHITENHELGREYVVCPLDYCQAPVRDLKLHVKVKHPQIKELPPGVQNRAIIWKDQSKRKDGKLKTQKVKFRSGSIFSNKNKKEIKYRSGLECHVYECLEEINEVLAYDAEPFEVEYFHEGQKHNYLPDLSLQLTGGRIQIWEIKPSDQTSLPVNIAKWSACENYCQSRGWKFKVITEKGLEKLRICKKTQYLDL